MGRIPSGWKKTSENSECEVYGKKGYQIYIWKVKKPRKEFIVEPFRKLSNYKRRLFSRSFKTLSEARKFAWTLMKQKEIRGYYASKIDDSIE